MGRAENLFNIMRSTFLGKREVPKEIKTEVVKRVARPAIIYSSETWTLIKRQKSLTNAMEMRFLRKTEKQNKKRHIQTVLQIEPINETIIEGQLRQTVRVFPLIV